MYVELGFGALLALLLVLVFSAVRILREYERGVVFQLGRFWRVKGAGIDSVDSDGATDGSRGFTHRGALA
ncbi:regulator of protease activity HflC (stomatin/prohibitin superfamily) [Pseudomonas baetica]|nr:regulator of protease activity HflC (stomatin/prohibitin superfamily) [Pseudomonas baetica]